MLNKKAQLYEFMVYPTLQTEWISGKGILLFSGLFLVEFGAGLFLASSILGSLWGQTAGWLISGVLGGGCHFLFLGHPFRIYKAIRRPGKAWISRGLLIISLFQIFCFVHLVLSYFSMPLSWVMIVADLLAIATILYGGFEIADVKAIPTWHSSFLPFQMLARSFFMGLATILVLSLLLGQVFPGINMKQWLLVTLFINFCLFALSLVSIGFEEGKEKLSISMIIKGDLKRLFWFWVIAGGMIIPLIIVIWGAVFGEGGIWIGIWMIAVILQGIGDVLLRYALMRSGYYPGIFPGTPANFK